MTVNNRQIRSALAQPKPKKLLDFDKQGAVKLYHGTKAKLKPGTILKTKPMDAEWRKRLDETLADEFQQRPDLLVLRNLLLEFGGGEAMVRRMDNSPAEVERLMERGKFWKGRGSTFRKMRSNQCHGNSVCLMKEGVGSVANGYALSPDGLWRQHSWIVTPDGGIVETTVRRAAYYGVILTPQEVKAEYSVDPLPLPTVSSLRSNDQTKD